ncbi:MAG: hypothetical protein LBJ31_07695 [Treponema sp.]|nr:hypothetical protein [Treponema sp.]
MMYTLQKDLDREYYSCLKTGFEKLDENSREFLGNYVDLMAEYYFASQRNELKNDAKLRMAKTYMEEET